MGLVRAICFVTSPASGSGDYSPHGFCYLWNTKLIALHVVSDTLIALAYFAIPVTLMVLARRRRDVPFGWMLGLFSTFIIACGLSHVLEVWNLWHTEYWLEGAVKAITALASIITAVLIARMAPKWIALPSLAQWREANATLQAESMQHRATEARLREQEAHYRDLAELVELTHDASFVRGMKSETLYWNPAAERLYGWTKEEILGRITHEFLHTEFPIPLEQIEATVKSEGEWEGQLTHTRRDGTKCVVDSRWALRCDANGQPVAMLESNRDVTARIRDEMKFRALLDSAPDAMVIVDSSARICLVNARAESAFGYKRDELIGQRVEMIIPQSFRPASRSQGAPGMAGSGAADSADDFEMYGRRKDGSRFPVEISLSPLETAEGTLISGAIRDVTERQRIQQDLRDANEFLEQRVEARTADLAKSNAVLLRSQERMNLAQNVARMGSFEVEARTRSCIWDPGMEALYGLREGTFDSKLESWLSYLIPEDRAAALACLEKSLQGVEAGSCEFRITRPDGKLRWMRSSVRQQFSSDGTFQRLVGVNLDVTEAREREAKILALTTTLEQRVEERTMELTQANKDLESFSYSVSHDLRAPLRHIDGFARILSEEYAAQLPEDAQSYLTRILKATTDMGKLIEGLIKLAHLGRRELAFEKIPMGELVKTVIADLPQCEPERSVEWRVEKLPTAKCDPDLMKAVLTNLISNALKFTRTRNPAVIEIGTAVVENQMVFFVRDNGVGFDPVYADKLFGVFQRLHAKEKFEGTGIGLATVQRIVQRHGGKIWAESALDQGATFYFTLSASRIGTAGADLVATPSANAAEPALVPATTQ
jgi:PAS domain S-box-containing protein